MLTEEQAIAIKKQGFKVVNPDKLHLIKEGENLNGVILQDGTLISLKGFNEHRFVYPFLRKLGLVNNSDWMHESSAIHISSNQLNGDVAHSLSDSYAPIYKEELVSEAQLKSLFILRNVLDGSYGDYDTITDLLYQHTSIRENHGGKYNGLAFLKKYYSDAKGFNVRLPRFSKGLDGVTMVPNGTGDKICIRTSPDKSLPGLLNSKFSITPNNYMQSIDEIVRDYNKYADLIPYNNIHWFFQQQLDGVNGVCNVRGREQVFSYDVSAGQGDIVQGKKGKHRLSKFTEKELQNISVKLAKEMRKSIQMEFVVSKGELYIVQFRLLKNEPEESISFGNDPKKGEVKIGRAHV